MPTCSVCEERESTKRCAFQRCEAFICDECSVDCYCKMCHEAQFPSLTKKEK